MKEPGEAMYDGDMTKTKQTLTPGTPAIVRPHGMMITDAVITGTQPSTNSEGFVYTYRRTSNGAEGIILPALASERSA